MNVVVLFLTEKVSGTFFCCKCAELLDDRDKKALTESRTDAEIACHFVSGELEGWTFSNDLQELETMQISSLHLRHKKE
jgi:hypothetical protein